MVYFFWEKNKVITTLKNLSTSKNPITEVSFHPKDRTVVCIVGQGTFELKIIFNRLHLFYYRGEAISMIKALVTGIFKMCRLTEGILKQFGFTKAEHHQMLCHDWLSSRHVTIGTRAGKVLLLEDAELKQTIDVSSLIESSDISATNGTYTLFYKTRLLFDFISGIIVVPFNFETFIKL